MQNEDPGITASPFPPRIGKIGLFAPAGIAAEADLKRGVQRLLGWGLEVCAPETGPTARFFAASDQGRAQTLNQLLADRTLDALIAIRGGYGCGRILGRIDWTLMRERGIPVVGYSDLTALHLMAYAAGCRHNVCGPMVSSTLGRMLNSQDDITAFNRAMASLAFTLEGKTGPCHERPLQVLKAGTCNGPVMPANLAVMASLVGTPFMPDLNGAILVLEDINEAAYRVDRCLEQLDAAIGLKTLGGLVFGEFIGGDDAQWLPQIFADFAARCGGPVCSGLPFGHGFPSISLPVGHPAMLVADNHSDVYLSLV